MNITQKSLVRRKGAVTPLHKQLLRYKDVMLLKRVFGEDGLVQLYQEIDFQG